MARKRIKAPASAKQEGDQTKEAASSRDVRNVAPSAGHFSPEDAKAFSELMWTGVYWGCAAACATGVFLYALNLGNR